MTTPTAYRNINVTSIDTDAYSTEDENIGFSLRVAGRERRSKWRFPIQLPAELCVRGVRFGGTTVNISSGGLLMKCRHDSVKIGKHVKVRITNWPNSSGRNSEVVLVMEGAVVRHSPGYVAVRRTRHEFIED